MPERLPLFDALKGFAILMVVYTHVLQFAGIGYYLDNPVFEFTYAFHMPLFMTISGYFSASSLQRPLPELLRRKAVALLLPCLTAGVLVVLLNRTFHWAPQYARPTYLLFNLWYLKSLFGCYLVAWLSLRGARGSLPGAIAGSLLASLFLPGLFHWPFMLPFFWLGYAWRRRPDWFVRNGRWAGLLAAGLFIALWQVWSGGMTVYIRPLRLVDYRHLAWAGKNFLPHLLRLAIGLAGTAASVALFTALYRHRLRFRFLERLGRCTLEIYVLHFSLIHLSLFRHLTVPYVSGIYEGIVCPLGTALFIAACLLLIRLANRSNLLRLLLFGKSENPVQ